MKYPSFFDQVETIRLQDPLSRFLGAFEKGELEITYLDCVKLAGHSCPTVAGAYLMAKRGLAVLFPEHLPQRGTIKVEMRDAEEDGVTGVVCNVISFILGANGAGGFKGIQGHFSRNDLVTYRAAIEGEVRLTRLDTGESVMLDYDPSSVPPDPMMRPLMAKSLQGSATEDEAALFRELWQARVEKILLDETLWDTMISVQKG